MNTLDESTEYFDVVINEEEQYSVWQVGREIPAGWKATGFRSSREECLAHIDQVWTDMRPRSVRLFHEAESHS